MAHTRGEPLVYYLDATTHCMCLIASDEVVNGLDLNFAMRCLPCSHGRCKFIALHMIEFHDLAMREYAENERRNCIRPVSRVNLDISFDILPRNWNSSRYRINLLPFTRCCRVSRKNSI